MWICLHFGQPLPVPPPQPTPPGSWPWAHGCAPAAGVEPVPSVALDFMQVCLHFIACRGHRLITPFLLFCTGRENVEIWKSRRDYYYFPLPSASSKNYAGCSAAAAAFVRSFGEKLGLANRSRPAAWGRANRLQAAASRGPAAGARAALETFPPLDIKHNGSD